MFEMQWWCYLVSTVLAVPVLFDARRRGLTPWQIAGWTAAVAVTWVAVVPYGLTRGRKAAEERVPV